VGSSPIVSWMPLQPLSKPLTTSSLHSRRLLPTSATALRLGSRYGPPLFVAAATAGYLSSASSPYAFLSPTQLDAPQTSWSILGRGQRREASTDTNDASHGSNGAESGQRSGEQDPPPQTRVVKKQAEGEASETEEDKVSAWQAITRKLSEAPKSVSSLGDTIVDYVVPDWAKVLPGFVRKLQSELSMAPGSLAEEIWYEANNPEAHPEIIWDASVRVSNDLCAEEKSFLEKRGQFTKRALARYLDIPENKIHPDDVPIIAVCGSGGGLRALVAGAASYLSAQEEGLFDCVTYTAGVSGSCWLQTLYYSNIAQRSHSRLIRHLKNRLGVHIAYPPDALELVASAPTNKYLLGGLVEKAKGNTSAEFGIVDIYGVLLAARLLVPKGSLAVDEFDFKLSYQRRYTDDGTHPLPIYTAVRHEIPLAEQQDAQDQIAAEAKARSESWFQWFEYVKPRS
jgi:phospholipase A2